MININLLPTGFKNKEEVSKSGQLSLAKLPGLPIMVGVLLVVLSAHIILGLLSLDKKMQTASLENRLKGMDSQARTVENIKKEAAIKKEKATVMESIFKRNLHITYLLNKINKAVPKGLWFSRINFSQKGLSIEGSVFSFDGDQVPLVNNFFDKLKSDSFFIERFTDLNIDSMQTRNVKQYEILDFIARADTKKEEKIDVTRRADNKRKR